jgi:hypothetical protein
LWHVTYKGGEPTPSAEDLARGAGQ